MITDFGSARRLTKRSLGDKSILNNMDRSPEGDPTSQENIPFRAEFCAATNTITITGDNYTIRWAAPELLKHNQSSLESDIWALGWIAYEVWVNPNSGRRQDSQICPEIGDDELHPVSRCQNGHECRQTYHLRQSSIDHRRCPRVSEPGTLLPDGQVLEQRPH